MFCRSLKIELLSEFMISHEGDGFAAWPSVTRDKNGCIWVAYSGKRMGHVCPFGEIRVCKSEDLTKGFSKPLTWVSTFLDDRDPGIVALDSNRLLLTWFTSTSFYDWEQKCKTYYCEDMVRLWNLPKYEQEKLKQSRDNLAQIFHPSGQAISEAFSTIVHSPHGPIKLSNQTYLYLGNDNVRKPNTIECVSFDDTFSKCIPISTLEPPEGVKTDSLCEPTVLETAPGELLAHFRFLHTQMKKRVLYETRSKDYGRSWSPFYPSLLLGYPAHLLQLADGQLLSCFGYRQAPFGIKLAFSQANGHSWKKAQYLYQTKGADIGYPMTLLLGDNRFFTVFYEADNKYVSRIKGLLWQLEK